MNLELAYSAFVITISIGWLLLILAPKWVWTDRIAHSIWPAIALGVWAVVLFILHTAPPTGAGMESLSAVMLLTNGPHGTLIVWTLLMGWDFIAGAWLARDARRRGIHHAWVILCLIVAYWLGILGLALYFGIRLILKRAVSLHEVATRA